jgi:sec-independent protein translocase protein TatA
VVHAPFYLALLGGWEWLVILLVVLLLFGNRIPGLARSLGKGINEFKAGLHDTEPKPDVPAAKADKPEGKA